MAIKMSKKGNLCSTSYKCFTGVSGVDKKKKKWLGDLLIVTEINKKYRLRRNVN